MLQAGSVSDESMREQGSSPSAHALRLPLYHMEQVEDKKTACQLILDHRLFKVEERGWGILKKAYTWLNNNNRADFKILHVGLAVDRISSAPVGVAMVECHHP